MKNQIRTLLMMCGMTFAALPLTAATATVNGIKWTYTVANGVASVGGGSLFSTAVPKSTSGSITIPSTLGSYPVTSIGDYAFDNCNKLTSVTMPNSVTNIGGYAFYNCSGLTSVTIPNSVTNIGGSAFSCCSGLTSVTIGNGVTNIGGSAFSCCIGLTSVTIPNSVTNIGSSAFYGCSGLTSVTILDGVTSIGASAFSGCSGLKNVTIPSSVICIGGYAFYNCSGLTSVNISDLAAWCGISFASYSSNPLYYAHNFHLNGTLVTNLTIPDGVTSIWSSAFYGCSGLTSVTIPDGVTSIGNDAFYNCSGLKNVTIPSSVTSIGDYAFYNCSGLTSVTIPQYLCANRLSSVFYSSYQSITNVVISDGVTSIGNDTFYNCSGLKSVTIPSSVTNIGYRAFSGCSCLTSVTIPNGVTSIGRYAFSDCSGLTGVLTIPDGVMSIGNGAFSGCGNLTSISVGTGNLNYMSINGLLLSKDGRLLVRGIKGDVVIPDCVTSIGEGAFSGCNGLTSVTIPNSVTNIGGAAFSYCSGLTSVTIPDGVTSIGNRPFYGCSSLTRLIIPDSVTNIVSATPLDISQEQNWPFPRTLLQNAKTNLDDVLLDSNQDLFWKPLIENRHTLCALDYFSLFDYLDENNVPLSLAIPCVERVPMLTALAPLNGNLTVEFDSSQSPEEEPDPNNGVDYKRRVSKINIKITLSGMGMRSTVVYPFSGGDTPGTFTTEAFARLVFVGTESEAEPSVFLRNNSLAKVCRPTKKEWNDDDKGMPFSLDGKNQNALFITLPSGTPQSWKPPRYMTGGQNCWYDQILTFKDVGAQLPNEGVTILRKIQYYKVKKDSQGQVIGEEPDPARKDPFYEIVLRPFGENGEFLSIPEGEMDEAKFTEISTKYKIYPYLIAWARVKNDNGYTVDMVPATFEDDLPYNEIDNRVFADNASGMGYALGHNSQHTGRSDSMPIMRFPGEKSFTYNDVQESKALTDNTWRVKSCYAVDPRFNWAPENWWFDSSDGTPTGQKWFNAVFGNGLKDANSILNKLVVYEFGDGYDRGDRATDPFLFVSDLGYLQSVGELAFLPHLSNMSENSVPKTVLGDPKDSNGPLGSLYNGKERVITENPDRSHMESLITEVPCALAAWKSYQNYRTNPKAGTLEFGANLWRRGLINRQQDICVNPFTQSHEMMFATITNTPLNYWVAGLDDTTQGQVQSSMFTGTSGERDVNKIATFLRRRFEDLASMIEIPLPMSKIDRYVYQRVWLDMVDALDWSGTLGCSVEDVYNRLEQYYSSYESINVDYREMYIRGGGNSYSDLNHYAVGEWTWTILTGVRLKKNKAVHKEDFSLRADPLRGQCADDTSDTSCWNKFYDVDRQFIHGYWRDSFANFMISTTWTPSGVTMDVGGKLVTVPGDWLTNITERIEAAGGDAVAALQTTAANGRLSNVECYILGLAPEDTTNDFKIVSFPMKADGTPDLANIVFDPPQSRWNVPATYKVKGAATLMGPWEDVPSGGDPSFRFFKVVVELP